VTQKMLNVASQVLQETAVANPVMLNTWIYLKDVRDKLLHPFDRERLRLSYRAGNSWEALKEAARLAPWMELRGEGLNTEVRAKRIPVDKFDTLEDAVERIEHLNLVFNHWKEIGHKLLMAEETIWNMREHIKASDTRLMRAMALIFHFQVQANEFRKQLVELGVPEGKLRKVDPPSATKLDAMWKGNLGDYGPLKLLLKDTGILDPDREPTPAKRKEKK